MKAHSRTVVNQVLSRSGQPPDHDQAAENVLTASQVTICETGSRQRPHIDLRNASKPLSILRTAFVESLSDMPGRRTPVSPFLGFRLPPKNAGDDRALRPRHQKECLGSPIRERSAVHAVGTRHPMEENTSMKRPFLTTLAFLAFAAPALAPDRGRSNRPRGSRYQL